MRPSKAECDQVHETVARVKSQINDMRVQNPAMYRACFCQLDAGRKRRLFKLYDKYKHLDLSRTSDNERIQDAWTFIEEMAEKDTCMTYSEMCRYVAFVAGHYDK
jgi:predicted nucleotide-binding protein (sugar kinase/HSP70/actin superfamily)